MGLPDSLSILFLISFLAIFIMIVGRYFLIAGIFHLYFHIWKKERWQHRKINSREYPDGQFRKEVRWSMITALIFSVTGALVVLLWARGYTKVYTGVTYPFWWSLFSLPVYFFLHETYYYWVHRLMHHPAVYKRVHEVHHHSHIPSPWTAFSFHPLEGLLQALIIPLIILFVPIHLYALIFLFSFMTFSSVINHLGIEVYPAWFSRNRFTRMLIGATHHSMHHKQFKYNYGLYFTFWDRWAGTESPTYARRFRALTQKKSQHPQDTDFE